MSEDKLLVNIKTFEVKTSSLFTVEHSDWVQLFYTDSLIDMIDENCINFQDIEL